MRTTRRSLTPTARIQTPSKPVAPRIRTARSEAAIIDQWLLDQTAWSASARRSRRTVRRPAV